MAQVKPKTIVLTKVPRKLVLNSNWAGMTAVTNSLQNFSHLEAATTLDDTDMMEDFEEETCPRKRRRLTHLTPEERLMRRKLKNRVAAQVARDRKKQRMSELEEALTDMETENKLLNAENDALRLQTSQLGEENQKLRERLGLTDEICEVNVMITKKEPASPGSAALAPPPQQETMQAFFLMTSHYLSMVMTLSLMCCLGYYNNLPLTKSVSKWNHKSTDTSPPPVPFTHQSPELLWWGPHQQSWNPSMN